MTLLMITYDPKSVENTENFRVWCDLEAVYSIACGYNLSQFDSCFYYIMFRVVSQPNI